MDRIVNFGQHGPNGALTNPPKALTGWPLAAALVIDEVSEGGFLRASCRARQPWRQAFAAALAGGLLDNPGRFLDRALKREPMDAPWPALVAEVADLVPTMKAREIVEAGLGTCPDGYLGALVKLRHDVLSPEAYIRLLDVFTGTVAAQRERRRVVEQLRTLDEGQLEAVECLDPALLHPAVASRIKSASQAKALNDILAAIRVCCSSATDDGIRQSLTAFGLGGQGRWVKNWLSKADVGVTALLVDDPEIEVISPENVGRVADRFNNCLKTMTARLLAGTWAAAVYEPAELILTFSMLLDGRWLLTGVYARGNAMVTAAERSGARAKVISLGERFIVPAETPQALQAICNVIDPFWLERDLDDLI